MAKKTTHKDIMTAIGQTGFLVHLSLNGKILASYAMANPPFIGSHITLTPPTEDANHKSAMRFSIVGLDYFFDYPPETESDHECWQVFAVLVPIES